jgi:outer membrane protein OmpA-like peptidoglycan-associated protein
MNRADRFLWRALATVAVSPLLFAGCAVLRIDHSKEVVAKLPSRHALARRAIEQLKYGNAAPFEVCADDACPKSTDKTLTRATQTSNADVVVMAIALPAITPSSKPPVAVIPPEDNKPAAEPDSKIVVINFASGAATLTQVARKTLDAIAPEARTAEIEIRGRTDELGSAQVNEVLARNRALAVRDYLHEKKLPDRTLIRVSAKGGCCYVAGNDTEEGRAANRRVEIELKLRTQATLGSNRNDRP